MNRTAFALLLLAACHAGTPAARMRVSWGEPATTQEPPGRTDVRTLNHAYDRTRSRVLIREVVQPTRAALDYAAYHANFMIADQAPDQPASDSSPTSPVTDTSFGGAIDPATLTADITKTPLSSHERQSPLAFAALSEYLLAHKVSGADALAALGSRIRSESWGLPASPGLASQSISDVFLHTLPGALPELWLKVEFAPWFTALGALPDQDRDGYPEVYARARAAPITPQSLALIASDYAGRTLEPTEVKAWANQLASYWYPSFNTDLVPAGPSWPAADTEVAITHELAGLTVAAPTVVMRGKPDGEPSYNVFVIAGFTAAMSGNATSGATPLVLAKTRPSPLPAPVAELIQAELSRFGGGSWDAWTAQLAPFQAAVRKRLKASPAGIKAFAGVNGFLFYRNSLDFVIGGDLEQQPPGKNPLPIIVAWKRELERRGVDFLFVPVPAKVEVFPDALDAKFRALAGQVVNPAQRQFLAQLAAQGVEVVDLLPPLLAARNARDDASQEPLYQRQDTHWSARGLELAAQLLAARVRQYPWYAELARHAQHYTTTDASFTRFGDLHSRLPESLKRGYRPETLLAHRVVRQDGTAYEDDPDSPIVVLGDSFTGVYELTDVEHAGLSAHIARNVSYPVDLVMSYGGGPNVRSKLLRRDEAALAQKKLVIWVMADRDLYNYWEDWQPVLVP